MEIAFSLDMRLELAEADEDRLVRLGAELGYSAAWTPATSGPEAFERCERWHAGSGLPTGISVAPASGQPPEVYAGWARRVSSATKETFTFGIGSGAMRPALPAMRQYVPRLKAEVAGTPPIYLAAMGPKMLELAGAEADGVCLNWCSSEAVARSRARIEAAASGAGRATPPVVQYIRVCLDPDRSAARRTLASAMLLYAMNIPAYRAHFVSMGFGPALEALDRARDGGASESDLADAAPEEMVTATGAYGAADEVASGFGRLAAGLDVAIVRVLSSAAGDPDRAEATLRALAPARAQRAGPELAAGT